VPLLFAFDQRLIVSSTALLTFLILISRETVLQARLLSVGREVVNGLGVGAVGGGGNPSLVSSMPPGVVPGAVDSASTPPSSGRSNYMPTQSQASYHSAPSSPSTARFYAPKDMAVDGNNNILVADAHNYRIWMIVGAAACVITVAGCDQLGKIDSTGASVCFLTPRVLALDERGRLIVADGNRCCFWVVEASLEPRGNSQPPESFSCRSALARWRAHSCACSR